MMYDEDDTDDEAGVYGFADITGANMADSDDFRARMDMIDEYLTLRDLLFGHVTLGDA